jgi:hypothetical protein
VFIALKPEQGAGLIFRKVCRKVFEAKTAYKYLHGILDVYVKPP